MQPTDQTSIACPNQRGPGKPLETLTWVYMRNESMTSGARYHLVATYSVMKPCSFGWAVTDDLARPKSQTLRSQLAFKSRFDGFRSRWMTRSREQNPERVWGESYSERCVAP